MTIFSPTRDRNEPDIIRALEAVGATVQKLHEPGVPDLLVGYLGRMYLLEVKGALGVKGGSSSVSLTERQEQWWADWTGPSPTVVRTIEEALVAIGVASPDVRLGRYIECPEHGALCSGPSCCCADRHTLKTYPRPRSRKGNGKR